MRAISDEAVKALINSGISTDTDADREYVCECIDNIPTVEPKAKVVAQITFNEEKLREIVKKAVERFKEEYEIDPKRGEWKIEVAETIYGKAYLLTCSECGETVSVTETALPYEHFCRNCGADMRGKDDDSYYKHD